jgi:hypothetical protein
MIDRSTDIRSALRDRAQGRRLQRGFFGLPGGLGAVKPAGGGGGGGSDPDRASRLLILHANDGAFPDTSTYARTVTTNGTISTSGTDPKFGAANAVSDAADECVYINDNTDMAVGTGPLTIAGWFKPTASGSEKFAICKGVNEGGGWLIGIGTGGVTFRSAGTSDLIYSGSLSSSAWAYIKCVFTSGGLKKIFVDGTEVSSASVAHNITTVTRLEVGACVSIGSAFQYRGEWDEIVISALEDLSTSVPTTELPDS